MAEKYDVAIIGAGIGGLIAGCYLAKEKLKVLIVEQHDKPGGYCTSFTRKGYSFDVGVHYLGGIKKGILRTILTDLDLKDKIKFNQFDPTDKIITPEASTYIHANPKNTIEGLKYNFSGEKKNIDAFFNFIRQDNFSNIYKKTRKLTFKYILDEFFKNRALKATLNALLRNIGLSSNEASALAFIILFREYILDPGYYPIGGIQKFPDILMEDFRKSGGNIILSQKVERILVKNNKAMGILLKNGNRINSNYVISNADARETFNKLLNKKTAESRLINKLRISPSTFVVYLGLNEDFKKQAKDLCSIWPFFTYNLKKTPVLSQSEIIERRAFLSLVTFPGFHNHTDKLTAQLFTLTSYGTKIFWDKNKNGFSDSLIKEAEKLMPSLKNYITEKEVATPITCERYTSNSLGSSFGWASTVKQNNASVFPAKTSLKGLFLVGHWNTVGTGQGGVPKSAFSGRRTANLVLREINKKWPWKEYIL